LYALVYTPSDQIKEFVVAGIIICIFIFFLFSIALVLFSDVLGPHALVLTSKSLLFLSRGLKPRIVETVLNERAFPLTAQLELNKGSGGFQIPLEFHIKRTYFQRSPLGDIPNAKLVEKLIWQVYFNSEHSEQQTEEVTIDQNQALNGQTQEATTNLLPKNTISASDF